MPDANFALAAYIPVLHSGYLNFIRQHDKASHLFVFDSDLLENEDYLRKELRALPASDIKLALEGLGIIESVSLLNSGNIDTLNTKDTRLVLPDEDISRAVAERYLGQANVTFFPVFLRWDRRNVKGVEGQDDSIELADSPRDKTYMQHALQAAARSPDIWRHVGATLVLGDKVVGVASNQPLSTQNTPWADGDPRSVFNLGVGIEMSTFMHAEARLIADAAKEGLSLKGAELYVTTFPCPACAMLIATCGIRACYFYEGYAVLDGLRNLREAGVEVLRVPMPGSSAGENSSSSRLYPEKSSD